MEVFYVVLVLLSLLCNIVLVNMLLKASSCLENIGKIQLQSFGKLETLLDDVESLESRIVSQEAILKQLSLDLKDSHEPMKPMKPINWDNMRKAFKGPTRVEINE